MQGGAQYRSGTTKRLLADATTQTALDTLLINNNNPAKDFKLIPYKHSGAYSTTLLIYTGGLFNTLDPAAGITYGANTSTTGWTPKDTQYQQIGDLLFLVNTTGLFKPKIFAYDSGSVLNYSLKDIDRDYVTTRPWKTIPWGKLEALDSNVTMTTPGTITVGTDITITASASYFDLNGSMVGKYLRLCNGSALDGVVRLKTYLSPTTYTCTVLQTIPNASFTYGSTTNSGSFWQISDWGIDVGWPKTITAFQGRIIFGGSEAKTDTIWGSRISNILDMEEIPAPNTTGPYGFASSAFASDNSRPFTLTPNSAQSSNIVALSSAKTLNIHTDALEIVAYGSNGALGPVNVVFESSSSFGASAVQPVRVNNFSTYVQANGYKLRDLVYNFNEDQYKSQDLGFVAEHFFIRQQDADIIDSDVSTEAALFPVDDIIEIIRFESRSSYLFCKTRYGKLYYITLDRDYQVNAWGRIVLGSGTEDTYPYDNSPKVLAMANNSFAPSSSIYMLVERTFNGVKKCSIEVFKNPWEYINNSKSRTNPYLPVPEYLDSRWGCINDNFPDASNSWKISPTTPGAAALFPGATLSVVADGSYIGEVTLGTDQPGAFTLPGGRTAESVAVGFIFPGVIKTSGIIAGGQVGTPLGRISRIDEVVVKVHNTGSGKVGRDENNLEELVIRQPGELMGDPTTYYSGNKVIIFPPGYERDYSVMIKQDKPYPMYVVSVAARGVTYD